MILKLDALLTHGGFHCCGNADASSVQVYLEKVNHVCRFSAIFKKRDNFCDLLFALLYNRPSEEGSTLKGNYLLPSREFVPFRVNPNRQGMQNIFDNVASLASISILLKMTYQCLTYIWCVLVLTQNRF